MTNLDIRKHLDGAYDALDHWVKAVSNCSSYDESYNRDQLLLALGRYWIPPRGMMFLSVCESNFKDKTYTVMLMYNGFAICKFVVSCELYHDLSKEDRSITRKMFAKVVAEVARTEIEKLKRTEMFLVG